VRRVARLLSGALVAVVVVLLYAMVVTRGGIL
jgi:hypothetical protein